MKSRVITAVVAGLAVLAAASWSGPLPVLLLLGVAVTVAAAELWALQRVFGYVLAALCLGVLYTIAQSVFVPSGWFALGLGLGLQLVGIAALRLRSEAAWAEQARRWLGMAWVVSPIVAAFGLHQLGSPVQETWRLSPLLMLLVPIWSGDTAAMLAGRRYGKRLLAPEISPKKTVEGSCANLAAAVVAGLAMAPLLGFPLWAGAVCGLFCGTLGQMGDLFESWLKRRAGVKDSGAILPGHGGLLDRIDALLFAAWPVYAVVLHVQHR